MGNNAAFSSFEASVIAVYNKGVLDKELLDALAAPYEGMDIDRGGMAGTLTNDGLDIDGVVMKVYGLRPPQKPKLPRDYKTWTVAQIKTNNDYAETLYEMIGEIEKAWGWR